MTLVSLGSATVNHGGHKGQRRGVLTKLQAIQDTDVADERHARERERARHLDEAKEAMKLDRRRVLRIREEPGARCA